LRVCPRRRQFPGRRWRMHTFGYNYYHELRILKG
jgi:hypothetical protein